MEDSEGNVAVITSGSREDGQDGSSKQLSHATPFVSGGVKFCKSVDKISPGHRVASLIEAG